MENPMHVVSLPYDKGGLVPLLSSQTVALHYDKHHKGYAMQLEKLVKENPAYADRDLPSIIRKSHAEQATAIFNNAAQVWNHNFYWHSLCPQDQSIPPSSGPVFSALTQSFGSTENMKEQLTTLAMQQFGSGWVWLVKDPEGRLFFEKTSNAFIPWIKNPDTIALFVCDVWEHAYYVDYQNRRKEYVERFVDFINWDFVAKNFEME